MGKCWILYMKNALKMYIVYEECLEAMYHGVDESLSSIG